MTRIVSDKQCDANRKNAAKSTSPTTAKGKARSARNTLQHGLLFSQVVVSNGDGTERPIGPLAKNRDEKKDTKRTHLNASLYFVRYGCGRMKYASSSARQMTTPRRRWRCCYAARPSR